MIWSTSLLGTTQGLACPSAIQNHDSDDNSSPQMEILIADMASGQWYWWISGSAILCYRHSTSYLSRIRD
ncbi:hypothetical protein FQN49_004959 [Arthroderma sp. PD_2]|nr:hypothetical protein FQN49_004959 [Arthroderma sp. PD_2]